MITPAQEQKFLSLIEEHKKIIYKVCYSYCRQTEDRNDLAQEIAIQLWKSFERYSIRSSRRQLSRLECGCRRCCDCSGDMGVPKICHPNGEFANLARIHEYPCRIQSERRNAISEKSEGFRERRTRRHLSHSRIGWSVVDVAR